MLSMVSSMGQKTLAVPKEVGTDARGTGHGQGTSRVTRVRPQPLAEPRAESRDVGQRNAMKEKARRSA